MTLTTSEPSMATTSAPTRAAGVFTRYFIRTVITSDDVCSSHALLACRYPVDDTEAGGPSGISGRSGFVTGTSDQSTEDIVYEIRVTGHLDSRWAAWFDGLRLTHEDDGTTSVRGRVVDQAALHGLLQRVRDVGLPLLSVVQVDPLSDNRSSKQQQHKSKEM
jgi:hypothetical protein